MACPVCGSENLIKRKASFVCNDCLFDSLTQKTVPEGWAQLRPAMKAFMMEAVKNGYKTEVEVDKILDSEWNGIYNYAIKGLEDYLENGMPKNIELQEPQLSMFKKIIDEINKKK